MRGLIAVLAAALAFSGVIGITTAHPSATGPATLRGAVVADDVLLRINAVRARFGLQPLVVSAGLSAAAIEHSVAMGRSGVFDHGAFGTRIRRFYPKGGASVWGAGENLFWGPMTVSASEVVRRWLRSPPHREHLLDASWREIGIAVYRLPVAPGVYGGQDVAIVTADFGVRL